jgi:hypothetical protein
LSLDHFIQTGPDGDEIVPTRAGAFRGLVAASRSSPPF